MPKVAVVTGANQGLGLALVRGLCRALDGDGVVYLTARDPAKGRHAIEALRTEGLAPVFHPLDVTAPESILALSRRLTAEHGGVDILVGNAAARIVRDIPQAAQVRQFVDTNNLGTSRIIRAFRAGLKDGARFIVVASSFGSLRHLAPHLHPKFDTEARSLEDIDAAMDAYAALVEAGTDQESGWPDWINIPSKIGQVAAMRIFAREMREEAERHGLLINAACPGLVATDASRPWFSDMSAAQTPDEAAADLVWLATLPRSARQPYGELVRHRQVLAWR